MTEVFFTKTDALSDEWLFSKVYQMLCEKRKQKANRLVLREAKERSLAAGFLLFKALERRGLSDSAVIYDGGKPSVARGNVHFNLSHSGERAMCVISENEVSCDCQKIGLYNKNLAKKYFFEREITAIERAEDKGAEFCRIWTLKESLLKLDGKGISGLKCADTAADNDCFFKEYELSDGYKYTVCSRFDDFPESMEFIEIK